MPHVWSISPVSVFKPELPRMLQTLSTTVNFKHHSDLSVTQNTHLVAKILCHMCRSVSPISVPKPKLPMTVHAPRIKSSCHRQGTRVIFSRMHRLPDHRSPLDLTHIDWNWNCTCLKFAMSQLQMIRSCHRLVKSKISTRH